MPKPASRKRKGPKSTRSGCLLCKPWKRQGVNDPPFGDKRAALAAEAAVREVL